MADRPTLRALRPVGVDVESDDRPALLNSVAVLPGGDLIVADGGNDRILRLSRQGEVVAAFGSGSGSGSKTLKEPVGAFVGPGPRIYVADWHNHRVVVLDDALRYVTQFGFVGSLGSEGAWDRILRQIRLSAYRGSRIRNHFGGDTESVSGRHAYDAIGLIRDTLDAIRVRGGPTSWFREARSKSSVMNKPNGAAGIGNSLVVTQKNNRCLSRFRVLSDGRLELLGHRTGPRAGTSYGRLGQIAAHGDSYFVCDSEAATIWELDCDLDLVRRLSGSASGARFESFFPFACCVVRDRWLASVGGFNLQFLDLASGETLHVSEDFGELHGVAWDARSQQLYVADRTAGIIRVFAADF